MRGYGRDYEHRNWLDRAEDTVRGWFGGGRDYDRDYGWSGGRDVPHRDWLRGPDRARGEGYRTNNWNNQHANWGTVDRAGGYYGMDYEDREVYRVGGTGYDRDLGRDRGRMQGGMGREMGGGWMGGRGTSGGMRGRGMMRGTGQGDTWMGEEYGGGFGASGGWGDYGRGAYGGSAWRGSNAGGVEPGRYFRGYGNGSTGGHGYEPY
ncbi:MAG: hypothetical protein ACJ8GN_27935 [Longimicrobiaceae bacterium]